MTTWESIAWAPICFGLTIAGLIVSWLVWRRRGPSAATRAVAWSLLPLAAYLTGAILLIGRIGSAVARFAGSFVFSPKSWAGVVLFGLAAAGFLSSGGLPGMRWWRRRRKLERDGAGASGQLAGASGRHPAAVTQAQAGPAQAGKPQARGSSRKGKNPAADVDDDLAEVAEILRRRGIQLPPASVANRSSFGHKWATTGSRGVRVMFTE